MTHLNKPTLGVEYPDNRQDQIRAMLTENNQVNTFQTAKQGGHKAWRFGQLGRESEDVNINTAGLKQVELSISWSP